MVSESSDEGIGGSPDPVVPAAVDPNRDLIELRLTLDRERKLRLRLEDQVRALESQLYPERIRELTQQVTLHYHQHEVLLCVLNFIFQSGLIGGRSRPS